MATVRERLALSLEVLREYQDRTGASVLCGKEVLGTTHTNRLIENGYLQQVLKGWYLVSFPGREGDSSAWYASYWTFVAAYCGSRFGSDWCLTPEQSIIFHSGRREAPVQLMVRSPRASNNVTQLLYKNSLFDIRASLPVHAYVDEDTSVRLFPPAEALVAAPPAFYTANAVDVRSCLVSVPVDEVIRILSENGYSVRAGRIAGALRNVGREGDAERVLSFMRRLGYDVRESDPFKDVSDATVVQSPHAVRIALLWEKMRSQIMSAGPKVPFCSGRGLREIQTDLEAGYVADAYHSLSIEGYRVTEKLIEKVRSGKWNPSGDREDEERKNALVARGYFQAYKKVKKSVIDIFKGGNPGEVFARDHEEWHFELFEPCVQAGIVASSDLAGYRTTQVYIRGSRHIPLPSRTVRPAMNMLSELIAKEENSFVRAVLGHFFFVYIHPYMDGNGRTARFLMNAMLCGCGLGWVVVPVERRAEYFDALEEASVCENIVPFAEFIAGLIKKN